MSSLPRFVPQPLEPPKANGSNGHGHLPPPPPQSPTHIPGHVPPQVDYAVVRKLHNRVTDALTTLLADAANVTPAYRRELAQRVGREVIADYATAMAQAGQPVSPLQENALLDAVVAGMFGAGRLQRLLDD